MASILVVEDVAAVLLSLRVVLEGAGHKVTRAENGTVGLGLLKNQVFDLVITDIWMPGSSGIDVIREGRNRSPETRFLAITGGDPNRQDPLETLREQYFGADAVLLKPFEKEQLLGAIAPLLDRAEPLPRHGKTATPGIG